MVKNDYNWWTDVINKEEVDRLSWWNHEENMFNFDLPISLIEDDGVWIASMNERTYEYLGDYTSSAVGDTKEEAIVNLFDVYKSNIYFYRERMLSYERFVPFMCGDWNRVGGKWICVFGINIYFRYGSGMKYGKYIPFTKLNISIYNKWKQYQKEN